MWGKSIEFWDALSVILMWTAGVATAIAAITGFSGSILSREVSVRTQRASDEKIAMANAAAASATLKLEQLRQQVGPRQLNRDAFLADLNGQPSAPVAIVYLRDDPECFDLAQQIWRALQDAHWPVTPPTAIVEPIEQETNDPLAMAVDGQPSGVTVVTRAATQGELDVQMAQILGQHWTQSPYTVLMHALEGSLGRVAGHVGGSNSPAEGNLRVVVAPR